MREIGRDSQLRPQFVRSTDFIFITGTVELNSCSKRSRILYGVPPAQSRVYIYIKYSYRVAVKRDKRN